MSQRHLMIRIESAYGPDIIRSAKRYSPTGTDPQDMYQEIILAVYHRVRRRKVSLRNRNAMLNTIKQRAIDQSRKALLHRQRFTHVPEVSETARYSDGLIQTPERIRVKELKARIRLSLPQLDARIVIELAFPSSGTRNLARHRPTREGPTRRKVNSRTTPTVRKWHVAKFFKVSDARVTQATRMAERVVGYVIEQEDEMEGQKTACQICGKTDYCRMARCDTGHLQPKGRSLTGKQGSALLSVCWKCEEKRGKGGGR